MVIELFFDVLLDTTSLLNFWLFQYFRESTRKPPWLESQTFLLLREVTLTRLPRTRHSRPGSPSSYVRLSRLARPTFSPHKYLHFRQRGIPLASVVFCFALMRQAVLIGPPLDDSYHSCHSALRFFKIADYLRVFILEFFSDNFSRGL